MVVQELVEETLTSLDQFTELVEMEGPCISIYLSAYTPENDSVPFGVRLHAALARAKQQLESSALADAGQQLPLGPLYDFAKNRRWEKHRGGLVIFCARGTTRIFRTPHAVSDSVHVSNHLYIGPLLPMLASRQQFLVLALSQKHVRLLRCTDAEVRTVELPASIPQSVEQAGAFDAPDHDLENRSAAGASAEARHRIHFGTGTAEEKADEYTYNFFKILDREINRLFGNERLPLILAGVDHEIALYRKANSYPHLLSGNVHCGPDRLANSEIYRMALDVLDAQNAADKEQVASHFSEKKSSGLVLTDPLLILTAARRGQIHHLLLTEKESATDEDELLNLIALETIRRRGQISTVSHAELPEGGSIAATLRYRNHETDMTSA